MAVLRPLVDAFTPSCTAICGVCGRHPEKTSLGDVVARAHLRLRRGQADPAGASGRPSSVQHPGDWKVALERFDAKEKFRAKGWFTARPVPYDWQEQWALWQLLHGATDPRKLPEAARLCAEWPTVIQRLWVTGDVEQGTMILTDKGHTRARALAIIYSAFPVVSPAGAESVLPFGFHAAVIGTGAPVVEDPGCGMRSARTCVRFRVEMECSALAEVARVREDLALRAVAMKGVMDLTADGRDDQFKRFAARASAECLLAFLRECLPAEARPAIVAPAPDCGRLPRSARTMVQRRASTIRPASMSG